jgi:hypothetical protein
MRKYPQVLEERDSRIRARLVPLEAVLEGAANFPGVLRKADHASGAEHRRQTWRALQHELDRLTEARLLAPLSEADEARYRQLRLKERSILRCPRKDEDAVWEDLRAMLSTGPTSGA